MKSLSKNLWESIKFVLDRGVNTIYLIMHRRADLDAISSSFILGKFLSQIFDINILYLVPEGISESTLNLISEEVLNEMHFVEDVYDDDSLLIFMDVGAEATLASHKDLLNRPNVKWLVDHHVPIEDFLSKFDEAFVDSSCSSTTEIILNILFKVQKGIKPSSFLNKKMLELSLYAILVETKFLQLTRWSTLRLVSNLLKLYDDKVNLGFFMHNLMRKLTISEKIAVMKGFQRLRLYRYKDFLLGISNVGAFHNILSSKLIGSGLDVAVIYSIRKEGCKMHIRISDEIVETVDIDVVNDIITLLIEKFGGSGGGHSKVGNIEFSEDICNKKLEEILLTILNIFIDKGLRFRKIE